jgi:hypothetical protein
MYEEVIKANEEIVTAKEKFDNEVLNVIKKVIEEANQKIEEEKLGPIQSYTLIMKRVNETLNNIKIECGMDTNEELDENLMNQIYEIIDPYEQKMEEGLKLFVSRGDNIDTLGELLEHNRELERIVRDIDEYYSAQDIIIR